MAERTVEFRVGRMALENNMLKADKRKGVLRASKNDEQLEFTTVAWLERNADGVAGNVDFEIVVLPEEATLKPVANSRRCFVLHFENEPDRNMFFWSQEPRAEQDDECCAAINAMLNEAVDEGDSEMVEAAHDDDDAHATADSAGGAHGPTAAQLAAILSSITAGGSGLQQNAAAALMRLSRAAGPSLSEVLRADVMVPLLQQPDMLEKLAQYLPEPHRNQEQLVALAHSQQFRQQLDAFSHVLQTGQLDFVQFGLSPKGFTVADFLQAIQEAVDHEQRNNAMQH